MSDRVLRQFGYEQRIPVAVLPYDGGVFDTIDYKWLHFADHLVNGLTPASEPHACSDKYIDWFKHISHPFISPIAEDERLHLPSRRRPRSPTDRDRPLPLEQDQSSVNDLVCQCFLIFCKCLIWLMCIILILQGLFRRVANILQKMVDCHDVTEGTTTYEGTQEAL